MTRAPRLAVSVTSPWIQFHSAAPSTVQAKQIEPVSGSTISSQGSGVGAKLSSTASGKAAAGTSTLARAARSFFAPEPSHSSLGKRKRDSEADVRYGDVESYGDDEDEDRRPTKKLALGTTGTPVPVPASYENDLVRSRIAGSSGSLDRQKTEPKSDMDSDTTSEEKTYRDTLMLTKFPNEIMDEIFSYLDPADKACFALTTKANYVFVRARTHMIPRQLCPHSHYGGYFPCDLSIKSSEHHFSAYLICY
jgi:hypothetical protein